MCPHFVFALQNGRLVFEFPGNGGGEGVFVIAFCLCTALLLDCPLFRPSPTNLSYLPLSFSAKTLNRSSFPTCRRSGSREIFYYYYSHQNRQIRQHCCQFTSCICQNCLFFTKHANAAPNATYKICLRKQNAILRIYVMQTWFNELNPIWSYRQKQGKMCKYRQLQQKQDILSSQTITTNELIREQTK